MTMSDQQAGHGLGPTRARVLRHLLGSEAGISVQAVSEALGIHSNTARFHLEGLVSSGYATRGHSRKQGQGRPRTLYTATSEAPVVETAYLRDLTQALVRQLILSTPEPNKVAESVGRAWGQEIGSRAKPATSSNGTSDDLDLLLEQAGRSGFAVEKGDDQTIRFHNCPYRTVSQPALDSICQIHVGMMRGYLEATGADLDVESLVPGDVCIARLLRKHLILDRRQLQDQGESGL